MAVLRLNAREFAEYHQRLAARFMPTVLKGVRSGAARGVAYLVKQTRLAPPANPAGVGTGGAVNTGQFLRGWRWKPIDGGAVIFQMTRYAINVENGRRAGAKLPPKWTIIRWAMRRLRLSEKEAKRAWYPIAKAIARRGLLGRNILRNAIDEQNGRGWLMAIVRDEVHHELERFLRRGR